MQADYVHALLQEQQLAGLATTGSSVTVVSADTAVALLAASSKKAAGQVAARLASLELAHGVLPAERDTWRASPSYASGLAALKDREVDR